MKFYSSLRTLTGFLFLGFAPAFVLAQNPVTWKYEVRDAGNCQADIVITATIQDGWFTYSQFLESDEGPVATSINFDEGAHFKLVGKAKEGGEIIKLFDKVFGMELTKFKHKAVFTQRVEVLDPSKPVVGYLNYMVCNDEMCLPPKDAEFSLKMPNCKAGGGAVEPTTKKTDGTGAVPAPSGTDMAAPTETAGADTAGATGATGAAATTAGVPADDPNFKGVFDTKRDINPETFVNSCGIVAEKRSSLFWVFIGGFIGGLFALLTPCVFPMVPLTVSFFTKRSKDRAKGIRNALWYGASIVIIYVTIGIILTMIFGPTVLNEMSTDMYFNLLFFVVFVIFALSFFGLFEIQLPSSWVNSSDKMADRGGALGIFFMAFTLALVSFSCTGPIVGTLLVETAKNNAGDALFGLIPLRPLVGMFGFGLALALPFALFAMFPGWLNSLPKSGSWMDNVKVTLGFVELALAFKFLSTADMVRHWGFLKFELFLGLWLIIALGLGLYQFGFLPLKGASGRMNLGRLVTGTLALAFSAYIGWGLFNYQSLSLLSGLAPPVHYNFFRPMDCPHGLDCFHDFDEGLAEARRLNKPVFVDFTGYGCVNCRKMEENVWHRPGVYEHLKENYVLVSLYVDDQERLFPDSKFHYLYDPHTGEKIRTKGDKWAKFEINNFGAASQPYYVLLHHDGKTLLNQPRGFTPDVSAYKSFLDCGYDAFREITAREGGGQLIGER
ncbi:MAG: cytochrome c biogenesis protein CcdA [Saprospiraceae bacterium]|nr:cytochrome c biogenesis protein CcdA [Saprospiraceae bacterium]